MYVCVCNSVTDRQLREAVEKGHDTLPKLRNELGVATSCGKCASCARQLLREIRSEASCSPSFVPAAA
jgi:bacterioferritin-associated ferredoxin